MIHYLSVKPCPVNEFKLRNAFGVIDNDRVLGVSNNSLNRSGKSRSASSLEFSKVAKKCDTLGDQGHYRERFNLFCLLLLKDGCASACMRWRVVEHAVRHGQMIRCRDVIVTN